MMPDTVYNQKIRDYLSRMADTEIRELLDDDDFIAKLSDDGTKELLLAMAERGMPQPTTRILAERFKAYTTEPADDEGQNRAGSVK
jgi:hypothetical protein